MKDTFKHQGLRQKLVNVLRNKGITDTNVLNAIGNIPRHLFMDSGFLDHAYQDKAFPIGADQTISQPYTVAFQTELLQIKKGDKILEIGTGSGCIAIAAALALPKARVTATDISPEALAVAATNVERHGVVDRLALVQTDHLDGLTGAFDLIVSNPPYVPSLEMSELPAEFGHEPLLGLVSGGDGLDSARRILQDAPKLMHSGSILVLEVGAQWQALEKAFPSLPFIWLDFEYGGIGVALLHATDLGVTAGKTSVPS